MGETMGLGLYKIKYKKIKDLTQEEVDEWVDKAPVVDYSPTIYLIWDNDEVGGRELAKKHGLKLSEDYTIF